MGSSLLQKQQFHRNLLNFVSNYYSFSATPKKKQQKAVFHVLKYKNKNLSLMVDRIMVHQNRYSMERCFEYEGEKACSKYVTFYTFLKKHIIFKQSLYKSVTKCYTWIFVIKYKI